MSERTFVLLKPDSVARGLIGKILSRIEEKGLKIIAMKLVKMDRDLAGELYSVHKGKKFYNKLIEYVTSGPVVAMVVEGMNAVILLRKIVGATDPAKAEMGSIRGDYGTDVTFNLIHAADSLETAKKEMNIFFKPDRLVSC